MDGETGLPRVRMWCWLKTISTSRCLKMLGTRPTSDVHKLPSLCMLFQAVPDSLVYSRWFPSEGVLSSLGFFLSLFKGCLNLQNNRGRKLQVKSHEVSLSKIPLVSGFIPPKTCVSIGIIHPMVDINGEFSWVVSIHKWSLLNLWFGVES